MNLRARLVPVPLLAALLAGCGGSPHAVTSPNSVTPPVTAASGTVTLLEDFTARQVFPTSNWWNLDVSQAPVDASSQAYIDWISGRSPSNPTAVRKLHPDFGPPPYGSPTWASRGRRRSSP